MRNPRAAGAAIQGAIPWIGMGVLLVLLGMSNARFNRKLVADGEFRENVSRRLANAASVRDSSLQVGEQLPALPLLARSGDTIPIAALLDKGYRFLYLYRGDCQGCMDLLPAWQTLRPEAKARIAFIEYRPGVDLSADASDGHHFGALGTSSANGYPLTEFVPAFVAVRADGRVQSVADGFAAVVRHRKMYNLVDPQTLTAPPPSAPANFK